jgi:hypothetical protein
VWDRSISLRIASASVSTAQSNKNDAGNGLAAIPRMHLADRVILPNATNTRDAAPRVDSVNDFDKSLR